MKPKFKLIEFFSGIGAQIEGINMTDLFDCEVVATSDIDKDAILSYAAIHCGLTKDSINDPNAIFPTEEKMRQELIDKNIGYDFKKQNNPISRLKGDKLKLYWLAVKVSKNIGDISKAQDIPYADMWTYSFPCQDISVAGKQAGIIKGLTRSGLLYEVEKHLDKAVVNNMQPKYLLLENVKNLVGTKFKAQFDNWIQQLSNLGYNTYYQIVNGKNCGVPQNRERVFALSIRKDVDTGIFEFMKPFDGGIRLKDVLDDVVDEKFYISKDKVRKLINQLKDEHKTILMNINPSGNGINGNVYNSKSDCPALTTNKGDGYKIAIPSEEDKKILAPNNFKHKAGDGTITRKRTIKDIVPALQANTGATQASYVLEKTIPCLTPDRVNKRQEGRRFKTDGDPAFTINTQDKHGVLQVGNYRETTSNFDNPQTGRVYDTSGCSPTLNTMQGGDRQPKIMQIGNLTNLEGNNYRNNPNRRRVYNENGLSPTLTSGMGDGGNLQPFVLHSQNIIDKYSVEHDGKYYMIRKLTPLECFRLMGFSDETFYKAKNIGMSDSALYKQAGNSIVTNCIKLIMEHLYKAQYDESYECYDENFQIPRVE